MGDTYKKISSRLARLGIQIEDHIVDGSEVKEAATTLDGIKFHPKDSKKLKEALRQAKDSIGRKAFATRWINKIEHKPIALSFAATEGTGFREIWRFPPLPETKLRVNNSPDWNTNYSSNFGVSMTLPDSTSLHCDVSEHKCNIHIDEAGFVIEEPSGRVVVTADLFQHTANELVFKKYS